MFVSYSSSDSYAIHTGISIYSLLLNNKELKELTVFLIDLGISDDNKGKIQKIVDQFNRKLVILKLDEENVSNYLGANIPKHYGSYATYVRLCAPIMYPDYVHRILFIDSDIIIQGSLDEVFSCNMESHVVAGVRARVLRGTYGATLSKEEELIIQSHRNYINCGFLLVDIDNWKRYDFSERIKQTAKELKDFTFKDQTILNAALSEELVHVLPCKYNYVLHGNPIYLIKKWSNNYRGYSQDEILEASQRPIVIHYAGDEIRPWFKENTSCLASCYYHYKKLSPYADYPLDTIFSLDKYRKQNSIVKLFFLLHLKTNHKRIGYPLYFINQVRIKKRMVRLMDV